MDPVTQGALGAACAQSILYPYDKKNVWIAGALSGMAADLDLVIRSSQDPLLSLIYHRGFTHSIFFIPIGGLIVAGFLCLFYRFRKHWRVTLLACLIGYATHGLLDACTSYGTVLLWPFSSSRYAWDVISIIDPFYTVPLVWGVIWTQVFGTRKGVITGLTVAMLMLFINIGQHHRAIDGVKAYAQKHDLTLYKLRAFPSFASSTFWRAAAFSDGQIILANTHTPIFSPTIVDKPIFLKAFSEQDLPEWVMKSGQQYRDYQVFDWFTDGYLIATSEKPLVLVDARYLTGEPLRALWGIQFEPGKNHIKRVYGVLINQ